MAEWHQYSPTEHKPAAAEAATDAHHEKEDI